MQCIICTDAHVQRVIISEILQCPTITDKVVVIFMPSQREYFVLKCACYIIIICDMVSLPFLMEKGRWTGYNQFVPTALFFLLSTHPTILQNKKFVFTKLLFLSKMYIISLRRSL